jgi:hypothetical protein
LRSKKENDNPPKKAVETKKATETKKMLKPRKPQKTLPRKSLRRIMLNLCKKTPEILQREQIRLKFHQPVNQVHLPIEFLIDKPEVQSLSKTSTTFSLEGELAKLKIPIPLSELMNKNAYRSQVIKALSIEPEIGTKALNVGSVNHSDTVNLVDDQPELLVWS